MLLCIENYFSEIELLKVKNNSISTKTITYDFNYADKDNLIVDKYDADGIEIFYLVKELSKFHQCRRILCKKYSKKNKLLNIKQIVPKRGEPLDYKGNYIALRKIWERVETENMMSWYSTLGGGFSALGDSFEHCAKMAGKISLRQLELGMRVDDPFIQARCKLYLSISLIQIGKLKAAAKIIREQYKFAKSQQEIDHRLVKMCEGIWQKFQYTYLIRKSNKLKSTQKSTKKQIKSVYTVL